MTRQVGKNGQSKATAKARDVTRQAEVLELVASGHTITSAARVIGVGRSYAGRLYQRALTEVMESNSDLRRELIAQDLETLRLLMLAHMPAAVGTMILVDADGYEVDDSEDGEDRVDLRQVTVRAPDDRSAKIVLSALDRRAKLLGLDAAVRVEVSSSRVNQAVDDIEQMVDEAEDTELAEVLELDARRLSS